VTDEAVTLHDKVQDFKSRTEAVDDVARRLHEAGTIENGIEKLFPVKRTAASTPLFDMERAVISFFGLPSYGVHMNGYVGHGTDMKMWIGERSQVNPVEPGKLDQLVAGGQPSYLSIRENLTKECSEEADLDAVVAARALPVSAITYRMEIP
jgi:hypothetical protein